MCLGIQLSALQEISKSVLFVQPKDIIRLNSDWFVLKESANISDITDSNTIRIIEPLSFLNSDNVPLELKNIKELPAYIPIGCGYSVTLPITTAMKSAFYQYIYHIRHIFALLMERCMIKDPALRQYFLFNFACKVNVYCCIETQSNIITTPISRGKSVFH